MGPTSAKPPCKPYHGWFEMGAPILGAVGYGVSCVGMGCLTCCWLALGTLNPNPQLIRGARHDRALKGGYRDHRLNSFKGVIIWNYHRVIKGILEV